MKSYIEKKIQERIKAKANSLLRKMSMGMSMSMSMSIERVYMLGLNKFKLSNMAILKSDQELIKVEILVIKLSVWSFLFFRQLTGFLKIDRLLSTWDVISEQALSLYNIESAFKIKRTQTVTLQIELNDIFLYIHSERSKDHTVEFRIKTTGVWDNYLSIFRENLFFNRLKHLKSSDSITITAIAKTCELNKTDGLFNTLIKSNTLTLNDYSENANIPIDKYYLRHYIGKRFSNDNRRNQEFIPYKNIPAHFINAIICTEDPNFWQHKGVDIIFIRYAILANLKSKKFERGASTITMQLTRNLFLNHDKNILRKLEESIIALLLENYYKIDKKDILEVYINLIEFAPNVRGLYRASLFYFGKPYTELSLTECIALTYIIPRPKHFYEALLIKSDQLKKNLYSHICKYANVMKRKGFISNSEYNNINDYIRFANDFGLLQLADVITEEREVKYLVVHCTGAIQNQPISNILSGWRSYGWMNPGYHYLIKADGTYLQLHPESLPSNGASRYNQESIHICYIGGVDGNGKPIDNRTPSQKKTLLTVLKELIQRYPNAHILGHRDLLEEDSPIMKSCPCFDAKEEYASLYSF